MDDEVQIVPRVVIIRYVEGKTFVSIPVNGISFTSTDEARIVNVGLLVLRDFSQLSKSIDDYTKNDVEQDGDYE